MDQIGRYQILEEIGRGAMGVVYRAQDPAIGRVIAIKTIRLTDLTDSDERQRLRERLFREAQSAGILSHPNIVTIYDIAEESGKACIFMEYVNGPPLEKVMSSKEPPDKQTFLNIFRQTASALDFAHRKGIVHRDIKPANVMIHEDGQAKVTDFGVAKVISHQMTQSGNIMGTPNYMSPEQVQGLAVDGRADQFALAVIAYELLTGEKPFASEYLPTLLYKIVREDPAPAHRLNPSLGVQISSVLNQGLAKNPAERFATCADFVTSLVEACNANPGWTPLTRGTSQSMPTIGGAVMPVPAAAPLAPARPHETVPFERRAAQRPEKESQGRSPLMRSLIWVLVGIGLVGLVLLGAQKFLFNPSPPVSAEQGQPPQTAAAPASGTPAKEPASDAPEPSKPSPLKQNPAGEALPQNEKSAEIQPTPARETARKPEAPAQTARSAGASQSAQMITDPPGANVVVDGNSESSCRTPCMLTLAPGRHTLNTVLNGYRPYPRIFTVPQESDVFMKLTKESGTLSITSSPDGASIQMNGDTKPQHTPAVFALTPGDYKIRVTRDGVPFDFEVQIKDGEFQSRNVKFQ